MHVENICYICCARKNNGTSCGNLLLFKNNIAVTGLATVVDAKAKPIGRADRYLFSRIRGAGMSVVAGTIYAHTSIGPTGGEPQGPQKLGWILENPQHPVVLRW